MISFTKKKINIFFYFKIFNWLILILCFSYNFSFKILANENSVNAKRFKNLTDQLRCPTCQGLSIKDSDAGFSKVIRGKIFELINEGKTDKDIKDYFVKRYGEWILRSPPKEGFNLLLWILPGIGILLALSWVFLRFKMQNHSIKEGGFLELTPEEEEKVNEALKNFEQK